MPASPDLFRVLTTYRLVLRKLKEEDLHDLFALRSNGTVGRYIARPIQQHISEAKAFIEKVKKGYSNNSSYYWVLSLKEDQTFIGSICLWNFSEDKTIAETGYEMLPEHHGKGYMHEALEAIIEYGFGVLELKAIEAFTHRHNIASRNLLERNNFVFCDGRVDEDVETNVIYKKER